MSSVLDVTVTTREAYRWNVLTVRGNADHDKTCNL